jgi:hypothetical protein
MSWFMLSRRLELVPNIKLAVLETVKKIVVVPDEFTILVLFDLTIKCIDRSTARR